MFAVNQNKKQLLLLSVCAALAGLPIKANAQSTDVKQAYAEIYEPAFFTQYSPQTSLDMVTQLPGFNLVETDDDIRGFAAGAGNVLIDGRRPTTKSGGIREALSRIPASQVAHVEVIRGASGTSDSAGQSVVANVIQIKEQTAKRWELGFGKANGSDLSPSAELLLSKQIKGWDSSVKLNAVHDNLPRKAQISSYSADKTLQSEQVEDRPSTLNEVFLSGDAARKLSVNQRLSINARLGWSQFLSDTKRDIYDNQTPDSYFSNDKDSQYYTGELGIEWQQLVYQNWQWRLLSVNNFQNWFVDSNSNTYMASDPLANISSKRFDEHKSEHVLRSLVGRSYEKQWGLSRQEYGAEIALNQLGSWLKLWDQANQNGLIPQIRNSFSRAEELRSEVFANFGWQFGKLLLEGGLAAEYSKIQVSGDSKNEQSLTFLKPSLAVIYNANQTTQYRWDVRRSVGQLDFSDFAASADLVNDREFSGNASLKPDTKIRSGLAIDHRFSDKGAATIEAYYEWRQDVLEHIILPSGDHALGNAGDAEVKGINASINLPLFDYMAGAQISIAAKFTDSEFDDPITGETRELSDMSDPDISIDFRQDLTSSHISWGIGYEAYNEYESFYVDEYSYFKTAGRWSAFIEGFVFNDFKISLSVSDLGDEKQRWERTLYQETRNDAIAEYQFTDRTREPFFSFKLSQVF